MAWADTDITTADPAVGLRYLFFGRVAVGSGVLTAIMLFARPELIFPELLRTGAFVWVALMLVQWRLLRSGGLSVVTRAAIQLVPDSLMTGLIVGTTGGIYSPFAFIFGLVVLASIAVAVPLFSLALGVLACTIYILSGYIAMFGDTLGLQDTLHLLMQTSAIMLMGGVVGAVSARQANLEQHSEAAHIQHQSLQKLHADVLAAMHEGVLILDGQMRVQDSNAAARRLLQLTGLHPGQPLPVPLPKALADFLRQRTAATFQGEMEVNGRDLLVRVSRLRGEAEAAWMVTIVDISQVRGLERQLAGREKMAALGQMAGMLAHEIRNPLQTMAQAHELMDRVDAGRRHEISGIIQDELSRLNRLVSDMLDYTRPIQPKPEMHTAADIISLAIHQADPEGRFRIRTQVRVDEVRVDAGHFRVVLDNLLDNALRFSPAKGSVKVSMRAAGKGWSLQVCDQGGGIAPQVRPHLFEPFVTGHSEGLGLGLATVWHICQANDWRIQAHDTDKGTCFEVVSEV